MTPDHRPAESRGHLALMQENGGLAPWCGPAALALAGGCGYAEACDLLRAIAPAWYPAQGPVVTAYWRDLLAALDRLGVPHVKAQLSGPRQNLLAMVRDGLPRGWYLVRVTDHFLLLQCHGFGLATVHDNRHTAALLSARTHGRRHVTHLARLPEGPRLGG